MASTEAVPAPFPPMIRPGPLPRSSGDCSSTAASGASNEKCLKAPCMSTLLNLGSGSSVRCTSALLPHTCVKEMSNECNEAENSFSIPNNSAVVVRIRCNTSVLNGARKHECSCNSCSTDEYRRKREKLGKFMTPLFLVSDPFLPRCINGPRSTYVNFEQRVNKSSIHPIRCTLHPRMETEVKAFQKRTARAIPAPDRRVFDKFIASTRGQDCANDARI